MFPVMKDIDKCFYYIFWMNSDEEYQLVVGVYEKKNVKFDDKENELTLQCNNKHL